MPYFIVTIVRTTEFQVRVKARTKAAAQRLAQDDEATLCEELDEPDDHGWEITGIEMDENQDAD